MHAFAVRVCTLVAIAAVSMATPAAIHAQVMNGNFEMNPQTGFPIVSAGAYIDAPGNHWKVASGTVNVGTMPAGTPCLTAGTHCVDLNGSVAGKIEQQLAPIPAGQTCTVRFSMSRHRNLAGGSASMRALINNTPVATFIHNVAGVTETSGKWEPRSFSFVSTGATLLGFETLVVGAAGPQIDDLSIACSGGGTRPPITTDTLGLAVDIGTPLTAINLNSNPCCPPWTSSHLTDRMYYQSAGGIGAGYTLRFTPNATLNTQLSAYVAYAQSLNGASNALKIDFSLFAAGVGNAPVAVGSAIGTGSATWSASALTSGTPNFFATGVMQVNKWYTVKTHASFVSGSTPFNEDCPDAEMSVRVQVKSAMAGGGGGTVLQVRGKDGKISERLLSARARP